MELDTRAYWAIVVRAGLAAAAFAGIVHAIGLALDVSMVAEGPGGTSEVPLILSVAQGFAFTVVGAGVAYLIARRSDNAARIYTWIAIVVFVLFTANLVFVAADGAATATVLTIEHVGVLAATLYWVVPELRA